MGGSQHPHRQMIRTRRQRRCLALNLPDDADRAGQGGLSVRFAQPVGSGTRVRGGPQDCPRRPGHHGRLAAVFPHPSVQPPGQAGFWSPTTSFSTSTPVSADRFAPRGHWTSRSRTKAWRSKASSPNSCVFRQATAKFPPSCFTGTPSLAAKLPSSSTAPMCS